MSQRDARGSSFFAAPIEKVQMASLVVQNMSAEEEKSAPAPPPPVPPVAPAPDQDSSSDGAAAVFAMAGVHLGPVEDGLVGIGEALLKLG